MKKSKKWAPKLHKTSLEFDEAFSVGIKFEIEVQNFFEDLGFYVMRSEGSKGIFDLIVVKNGKTLGIQCKRNILYLDSREYDRLNKAHKELKIPSIICCKGTKNRLDFLDCSVERTEDGQMKLFDIYKYF